LNGPSGRNECKNLTWPNRHKSQCSFQQKDDGRAPKGTAQTEAADAILLLDLEVSHLAAGNDRAGDELTVAAGDDGAGEELLLTVGDEGVGGV
jgi:hypothetical protein